MNKRNLSKVNIIYRRQRGRVVGVLDLQSGGPEFKSRSDRLLDLFTEVRVQILGHACK